MYKICISVFMWDIILDNEKSISSFEKDLAMFNTGTSVSQNGTIMFSRELVSNIQCSMDLRTFPHDVQHCEMSFISFNYVTSELNFTQEVFCGNSEPCDSVSVVESSAFTIISIKGSVTTKPWKTQSVANLLVTIGLQRVIVLFLAGNLL